VGARRDGGRRPGERLRPQTGRPPRGARKRPVETVTVDGRSPDPAIVARATDVLLAGGLLIYPTDTLYALGGRASDSTVASRVAAAKGRAPGKPLPLIAADTEQAAALGVWPPGALRLAEHFWPGPLTLVLAVAPGLPQEVTQGTGTLAVRVPDLSLARQLCRRAGPLISTSANRAGAAAPRLCAEALAQVGAAAELALDAGPGGSAPSTIVDVTLSAPKLLRAGAVPWTAVEAVWSGRAVPW
jgi:L-threonylcarbamoyladenylate synthase